jgi:hypothetical protein
MTQAQQIAALQTENKAQAVQIASLTLAVRQILEGKLTGAEGAAGTVVALEGGQTSLDVHPFDSCP